MKAGFQQILKKFWGYEKFRPLQEEIITSAFTGVDTLALLPTGGGKSICFQVPGIARKGVCIVITPLISLMKDQVHQLNDRGIPAKALYSGLSIKEIDTLLENCVNGRVKFLYVSPERIRTRIFIERLKRMSVGLMVIDEAHCISQWGHDFRPQYLKIGELRELIPDTPVIAVTATATKETQKEIVERLLFKENHAVFKGSFSRPNLSFSVSKEIDTTQKMLKILNSVEGSSIVYTRTRKMTKDIASLLLSYNINAEYYHGGLMPEQRSLRQESWIKDHVRVMVATNAFGMGIDKPNVRTVINIGAPESIEAYYQEAGRGGRDGEKSYAILLVKQDAKQKLLEWVEQRHPDIKFIRKVYQNLGNLFRLAVGSGEMSSFDFYIKPFIKKYELPAQETYYALKRMEEHGILLFNESVFHDPTLIIKSTPDNLYDYLLRHPHHELLMKGILRMYGGELYNSFVRIDEKDIAMQNGIPLDRVTFYLQELHNLEIVDYKPKRERPQVTYLMPRHLPERLPIDRKLYALRKQQDFKRAKAMIHFVQNTTRCRSIMLREYFGDFDGDNCGVCDVCIHHKKAKSFKEKPINYSDEILMVIKKQPMSVHELESEISPLNLDYFGKSLTKLFDEKVVHWNQDKKIAIA
ncbi:RecQ family ATP-dependent DNA helicase [Flammeovirga pacifica]|uniref:ATP-dependent DNA helicase RecQ n=1 Tax=Flammeovirga pacifica TaxID=915059 RepID=A0A1S1YXS9_FLAPC|nr:ATP-dependent DNA helicase RecQ [Flammeovirga pacifica]OHX65808.1 hypothetical protein NH26_05310 [Flammeovirga pacifica]